MTRTKFVEHILLTYRNPDGTLRYQVVPKNLRGVSPLPDFSNVITSEVYPTRTAALRAMNEKVKQVHQGRHMEQNTNGLPKVEMWEVHTVKHAPFQPANRTEKAKLRVLREDIKRNGIMSPLLWSTVDNCLGDGHRRLQCAIDLGMTHVPVLLVNRPAADIFIGNAGVLPMTGRTYSESAGNGLPTANLPARYRIPIEIAQHVLGDQFTELARVGCSTHAIETARRVVTYIGDETDDFLRVTILWMQKLGQQRAVYEALRDGIDPEVLRTIILACRPITKQIVYA